jgi:hypothetical protein
VSLSSTSTLLRLNAISSLGSIHTRPALLVLVSLMETNAPPPTDFDKKAILEGRPADYTRRQAERTLRDSCHRNFGMEPAAWRKLITDEFN